MSGLNSFLVSSLLGVTPTEFDVLRRKNKSPKTSASPPPDRKEPAPKQGEGEGRSKIREGEEHRVQAKGRAEMEGQQAVGNRDGKGMESEGIDGDERSIFAESTRSTDRLLGSTHLTRGR